MEDTRVVTVVQLAAITAGMVVVALASRAICTAVIVALEELNDRAGTLQSWTRELRGPVPRLSSDDRGVS